MHQIKTYRIVCELPSRARLGRGVVLSLVLPSKIRCTLRTIYTNDAHGTPLPGNLELAMLVDGIDVSQAVGIASFGARTVGSVMSYLANGPVDDPQLRLALQVAEDSETREYHCFQPNSLGLRSTTRIGTTALNDMVSALYSLDEPTRQRVERAMHWHSVALGLPDPVERFQAVFTAYEALNPILAKHLGIDSHEIRKCKKCGEETTVPVASGVHAWLDNECGPTFARRARDLRNAVIHSYKDFREVHAESLAVLPKVEAALLKAISISAGSSEIQKLIPADPLIPTLPFLLALHGTCEGPVEEAYLRDGSLPIFEPVLRIRASDFDPTHDRANVEIENVGTLVAPDGVKVQINGTTQAIEAGVQLIGDVAVKFIRSRS